MREEIDLKTVVLKFRLTVEPVVCLAAVFFFFFFFKKRPKNGCEEDYRTCGLSPENICYPANERRVDHTKIIGGIFVEIKKN